jgi:hypothetical protein
MVDGSRARKSILCPEASDRVLKDEAPFSTDEGPQAIWGTINML